MMNAFNHPGNVTSLLQIGQMLNPNTPEVRFSIGNKGNVEMLNVGDETSLTINNGTGHAVVIRDSNGDKILQLEDNGLLRGRHFRIDLDNWADYVFEDGYVLMTLEETEKFVEANKHLPVVKPGNELQEEGMDLGEMHQVQMQKIEELYLHVIELNKKIKELESEIETLKGK